MERHYRKSGNDRRSPEVCDPCQGVGRRRACAGSVGSGNYIGACAVQGRKVYGHKVLRQAAIRAVYAPGSLGITLAASDSGKTIATVTGGSTYAYKLNPTSRATYNETSTAYDGTSLTSGTTKIEVSAGDVLEIVNLSSSKVNKVGYVTVTAADIGT